MKIAYFISTIKKEDGAVRVLLKMIEQATKNGMECVVVSGHIDKNVSLSIPFIKTPSAQIPFYKDYYLSFPNEKILEKKLNLFHPDIIHVHSPDLISWAALRYANKNRIPIIATHHTNFIKSISYYHLSYLRPFGKKLLSSLYNKMDTITTPSSPAAKDLLSLSIKNVKITPWGTNLEIFNPNTYSVEWRKNILKDNSKNKIILSASRLTWEKDLKTLTEVYSLLNKNRNDFSLVIAGDGPIKLELKKLMPKAIFLGHLNTCELAKAYASSDIFLFPSSIETFGNVTIEAMASGLVPIVADQGGSISLVEDGFNGLLAKAKNPQKFYEKTIYLLDNAQEKERMRNNAMQFSKNYSWENTFDKTFTIYEELIKKYTSI